MAQTEFEKKELFETRPIPKAVAALSVPTVLACLVAVLYSLADTYFVGLLNDPVQTAAVTLASPVILAFNAVNNLFGVGASSMMSRALGRQDYKTLRQSSSFGFWGALAGGLLISIFCTAFHGPLLLVLGADSATAAATSAYMKWTVTLGAVPSVLNVVMCYLVRSEGAAFHAGVGTMSGCFLNIILDPVFILVFGMGSEGAALATFLSNGFACLYFLGYLFFKRKKTMVCIDPRELRGLQKSVVLGVFGVGIPASIQNLLNVTGSMIFNNLTAPYGAAALAAMGICQKICMVPMYITMGISQGIMPLVSYNYASGNARRMKDAISFTRNIAVLLLAAATVFLFVFSEGAVSLFIQDQETVVYGTRFLRGLCLAIPFLSLDFLGVGVYQALGKGKTALFFAIARKILLEIPFMLLFNRLYPLYGLTYAQPAAEFILAIAAQIILARMIREALFQ